MTWTRRRADQELDDEMTAHLELAIRDLVARGLDPNEARLVARREFGNVTGIREAARDLHRGAPLERLVLDVRHAWRRLRARPGTAAVAIAMLAVAIGLSSAMFTVVDALLLRPAPFLHPESLVSLALGESEERFTTNLPLPLIDAWRHGPPFVAVHAVAQQPVTFGEGEAAQSVPAARITPGLIEELGVAPLLGRTFLPHEGRAGDDEVALVSETIWRARFGGDPTIVGRRIALAQGSVLIVGVMPASFAFPFSQTRVWRPLDLKQPPAPLSREGARAYAYARLPTSIPRAEIARLAAAAVADMPVSDLQGERDRHLVVMRPIGAGLLDDYSASTIRVLAVGVGLVFLVLCVNVTTLMLARLGARRREFALCSALGASAGRLLRQALCEQLLIGLAAAGLGVAVGGALVAAARAYLPEEILWRTLNPLDLDLRALVAASALSGIAAVIAGVLPASMATRRDAAGPLQDMTRSATPDRGSHRMNHVLLVAELALAVSLSVAAGVQLRSFVNLLQSDRGFDAQRLVAFPLTLPADRFPRGSRDAAADSLRDSVRGMAGVDGAAVSLGVPPRAGALMFATVTADVAGAHPLKSVMNGYYVAPDFFSVYGVRLTQGRALQRDDPAGTVVISQTFADTLWPGGSAVGRTFRFDDGRTFSVVGVSREIRNPMLDPRDDEPEVYELLRTHGGELSVTVRCGAGCPAPETLRSAIRATTPGARVGPGRWIRDDYGKLLERPRAGATVAIAFAGVALLAVGAGLFAVLTRMGQQRQREFGIRLALGATPADLRRLVHARTGLVAGAGLGAGAALAWAIGRWLGSIQYQVHTDDPLVWVVVITAIGVTAAAAAWRPARQAMRADPVALLRAE